MIGSCLLYAVLLATSKANGHGEYYVKSSFETQDAIFKSGRQPLGQPRMLGSDSAFSTAMNPASRGIQHCEKPPLAYINPASGWAWSGGALQKMYQKCKEAGVSFARGQVTSLIIEDGDVRGARTRDGQDYRATTTMLAAGSWSTALFPELKGKVTATGQPLATIQLSSEEAELYRRIVSLSYSSRLVQSNSSSLLSLSILTCKAVSTPSRPTRTISSNSLSTIEASSTSSPPSQIRVSRSLYHVQVTLAEVPRRRSRLPR